ncbi:MAG: sigma-54 dependent transcriptional regulator [Mariprofundaceae bacterium]|nr:sigma-54 dependent transcriptional regulator [Mariprofundaceae bacterium]
MNQSIMIVDDEPAIRESLQGLFEDEMYRVSTAPSGEEAVARFRKQSVDCILLDIWMPGIDGLETMLRLHQMDADLPIIIMSGHATIDTAVRATRQGAFDFVEKPFSSDKLTVLVRNALEKRKLQRENHELKDNIQQQTRHELLGESTPIQKVRQLIQQVARTDTPVLILGEHGTGKAVAARMLHLQSNRKEKPFSAINLASIPEGQLDSELFGHEKGAFPGALHAQHGRFERAHGGSLFFDEISDMSLSTQAKILRTMHERRVQRLGNPTRIPANVRVLGATSCSPESLLQSGKLREDFYYRLNVITIHMPRLRDRIEDLPLLIHTLAFEQSQLLGGEPVQFQDEKVLAAMQHYTWFGNIRELRNYIERCHILHAGKTLDIEHMPPLDMTVAQVPAPQKNVEIPISDESFSNARKAFERQYLLQHLNENNWNISQTAAQIGMERTQLHRKIKSFRLTQTEPNT